MRRIVLLLTVVAMMAAMMVTAGPAKADVSFGGNSFGGSFGGNSFGGNSFDLGDNGFDLGDDDEDGDEVSFTSRVFFVQRDGELDDFEPEGIDIEFIS